MKNTITPIRDKYLKYRSKTAVRAILWQFVFEAPTRSIFATRVLARLKL